MPTLAQKPVTTPIPVQLSDTEFHQFILPHLSMPKRGPKCKLGYHRLFNLILWVLYTGMQWKCSHSTELRGRGYHHSSKACGGEDLQIEEPVCCGYSSAFHFDTTLTRMLGATLIRDEVVQVGEPREKRLLAATWMMESLHREQFPIDGVMGLIQQGAGRRHLGIFKHRIPACFLALKQLAPPIPVGLP